MKRDIKSLLYSELEDYFIEAGEPKYRVKQVFSALHKGISSFSGISNIPLELRQKLDNDFLLSSLKLLERQESSIDGTVKYLWQLFDGQSVECVVMQYQHGITICISTQVGCKMGCLFCASAINGFKRDLTASEMLDQILFTGADLREQKQDGQRIKNVVLMGIGEPLDNFENVIQFIKIINDQNGINIGARHITVSTCGIIENIDKLAQYDVQLTLAISLHAPDDEIRKYLMPGSNKAGVNALIEAGNRYYKKTGRRVTYEYALIKGINDSKEHAVKLSMLLKDTACHVNIITLSTVKESGLTSGSAADTGMFSEILTKNGINSTVRRSLGSDIEAACGQLRHRKLHE